MSERNNIDRLFQEKFKDFEVAPPEKVWGNIQSKMSKKDKKFNILPLFLILSGFAAVVVIGLSVTNTFRFNPFNSGSETVTNKEEALDLETTNPNPAVVSTSDANQDANLSPAETQTSSKNSAATYNNKKVTSSVVNTGNDNQKNNSVASKNSGINNNESERNTGAKQPIAVQAGSVQNSEIVKNAENKGTDKNKTDIDKRNADIVTETESDWLYENNSQSKIAYETRNNHPRNATGKETNTGRKADSKNTVSNGMERNTNEQNRNDAVTFISTTSEDVVAKDSIALTTGEIVEVVTPEETEEKPREEKKKEHKIIVSTLFSPVYMNLNGYGSALDAKFNDNSKSYRTSVSYGVGIMYPINNKWSVRTGLNILNFEYNTNDIVFYESQNGAGLQYVNENGFGSGVTVSNTNPKGIPQNGGQVVTTLHSGELNQKIGYVELPVEVSYKILNKRFTVDVIGGFSSMFLNDNRVSLVSSTTNTTIGEANNLNKVHFSSNVGVGFRYGFLKSFQANFEPMFKYQFNTFSNESGDFKPYFFGLYTGLSYRF
ncbi:outer membrane beta-barrel protein [Flavobacterium enshiense]|uniref:outer membrane beta-barrel protein n=1 Tax=Flavobacterium enshiense TaxID=1341165 RepID=UPI00345D5895